MLYFDHSYASGVSYAYIIILVLYEVNFYVYIGNVNIWCLLLVMDGHLHPRTQLLELLEIP